MGNFLLIRPGGIGDAVHLVPTIQLLRERFSEAAIDILAEHRNADVFQLCTGIRSVFRYDSPSEFFSVFRREYDVVIDTEQWHRLSAVVARLVGSKLSIGFGTNERSRLFTHPVSYSHDDYEVESFLGLLGPLGIEITPEFPPNWLELPSGALDRVTPLLGRLESSRYAVIVPGASIPERRWGALRFREVTAWFNQQGIAVVVVGGKADLPDGDTIAQGLNAQSLAGKTSLAETAAIISRSILLVSGDSGILHIGVGLGVPTVSLFGPGIAAKWAPRGWLHRVVDKQAACSPCTSFGVTPPCSYGVHCMADISVADLVSAVSELLPAIPEHR
jgi:ADP-heptose:LPS heptosyltransferase